MDAVTSVGLRIVPVALELRSQTQDPAKVVPLRSVLWARVGDWMPLEGRSPEGLAEAELAKMVPRSLGEAPQVEPAGFVEESGAGREAPGEVQRRVTLIYTAPVPVGVLVLTGLEGWEELSASKVGGSGHAGSGETARRGDLRRQVLNYWRNELEETGRVVDLLPEYFTRPQVADAYSAVWGDEQPESSIASWWKKTLLHQRIVRPIEPYDSMRADDLVRREVSTRIIAIIASLDADERAMEISQASVPVAERVREFTRLGSKEMNHVEGFVQALVAAGSLVGWRSMIGRPPAWFKAAGTPAHTPLVQLYGARPAWIGENAGTEE